MLANPMHVKDLTNFINKKFAKKNRKNGNLREKKRRWPFSPFPPFQNAFNFFVYYNDLESPLQQQQQFSLSLSRFVDTLILEHLEMF